MIKKLLKNKFVYETCYAILLAFSSLFIIWIYLSFLETSLIYPITHSYNIGPPFFWTLMMSPMLIIPYVLVVIFSKLFHKWKLFKFPKVLKVLNILLLISSVISVIFMSLYLASRYRDIKLGINSNIMNTILSSNFQLLAPLILNWNIFSFLKRYKKLSLLTYTIILLLLAFISIFCWWTIMGYWEVGK